MKILHMRQESRHGADFHLHYDQPHSFYLFVRFLVPTVVSLENTPVTVGEGTVIVYDPGAVHDYCPTGDGEFVHDYLQFLPESPEDHRVLAAFPLNTPLHIYSQRKLTDLLHIISREFQLRSSYTPEILSDLHRAFLYTILSERQFEPLPPSAPHFETLSSLRNEIYRMPAKPWSLEEMSRCTHLSQSYLQALYRSYFHISCGREVIRARVRMAASLLQHTNLSIRAIGESCGYTSQEHFIRQFRACRGITPLQYRKSLGKEQSIGKIIDGPGADPV